MFNWFTSTGTAPMSAGNSNSIGATAGVRNRSPGGNAVGAGSGASDASTKPHSPKVGTGAWYGLACRPAARIVSTMHQNACRETRGEVLWNAATPSGLSRSRSRR